MTDSASHPNVIVSLIVGLAKSPPVADDRVVVAQWAQPRQQLQRNYPGSMLSWVSGSAIKRITAGVKPAADRRLLSFDLLAGPSPSRQSQFERKKNTAFRFFPRPLSQSIGRFFGVFRQLTTPA